MWLDGTTFRWTREVPAGSRCLVANTQSEQARRSLPNRPVAGTTGPVNPQLCKQFLRVARLPDWLAEPSDLIEWRPHVDHGQKQETGDEPLGG